MDGRPTWTDCDEAGDYVVPNVLSPRDLVFRPDNMDETVQHTHVKSLQLLYQQSLILHVAAILDTIWGVTAQKNIGCCILVIYIRHLSICWNIFLPMVL